MTINTPTGVWYIQSAETIYGLRMVSGHTEDAGELLDCGAGSIYRVLKEVDYR